MVYYNFEKLTDSLQPDGLFLYFLPFSPLSFMYTVFKPVRLFLFIKSAQIYSGCCTFFSPCFLGGFLQQYLSYFIFAFLDQVMGGRMVWL